METKTTEEMQITVGRAIRMHSVMTEVLKAIDDTIDDAGLCMLHGTVEAVKRQLPATVGGYLADEANRLFATDATPTISEMRVLFSGMAGWLAGVVDSATRAAVAGAKIEPQVKPETSLEPKPDEGYGLYL